MSIEAATLGTPSILFSSAGKLIGIFQDLEKNYGLLYVIDDNKTLFNRVQDLLRRKNLKKEWGQRRRKLLKDKVDVTKYIVNFIENYK